MLDSFGFQRKCFIATAVQRVEFKHSPHGENMTLLKLENQVALYILS